MRFNIHLIRVWNEGMKIKTKEKKSTMKNFKKTSHNTRAEFSEWSSHPMPNKKNENKLISRHIIMNFLMTGDKQEILQAYKGKRGSHQ